MDAHALLGAEERKGVHAAGHGVELGLIEQRFAVEGPLRFPHIFPFGEVAGGKLGASEGVKAETDPIGCKRPVAGAPFQIRRVGHGDLRAAAFPLEEGILEREEEAAFRWGIGLAEAEEDRTAATAGLLLSGDGCRELGAEHLKGVHAAGTAGRQGEPQLFAHELPTGFQLVDDLKLFITCDVGVGDALLLALGVRQFQAGHGQFFAIDRERGRFACQRKRLPGGRVREAHQAGCIELGREVVVAERVERWSCGSGKTGQPRGGGEQTQGNQIFGFHGFNNTSGVSLAQELGSVQSRNAPGMRRQ